MPVDMAAMATEVVLMVKTALAPVLERLAAAEARLAVLGDVRDRVVAVETKAAVPVVAVPDPALGDIRDRLLVVETKAAQLVPVDVAPLSVPLVSVPLVSVADVADVRDRLVTLETRSAGPSVTDMGLVDVRERLASLERRVTDDALAKELGSLRERVAVVEVKAPVPGQPGKDGQDGAPGRDGTAGKDGEPGTAGLSFEGVYQDGKSYEFGNLVTWAGSSWHCNEVTTTKPGDGSKAWTLMVKRGRDGKDGRDGTPPAIPVVSVGGPR